MEKVRIACGEWGSCFWEIDSSGTLDIGGGTGYSLVQAGDAPWYRYRESIKNIRFTGMADVPQGGRLSYMFCGCGNVAGIDLTGLVTGGAEAVNGMFHSCSSLRDIRFGDTFYTGRARNMSRMFFGCRALEKLDISFFDTSAAADMSSMFEGCENLKELDLSSFDTGSLISMSRMFGSCSSLRKLEISGFRTSSVTGMSGLFAGCEALEELDLSGLDTSNVINMISMFSSCSSLRSLDLAGFSTGRVTDMSWMFCGCSGLEALDISSFDTSGVTDMSCMFFNCRRLEKIDVSGFDVSSAVNMDNMFMYCSSLKCLDLSGFDTVDTANMKDMFKGCEALSSVTTGERFDFHADSETGCSLPDARGADGREKLLWIRASDGEAAEAGEISSCQQETYYIRGSRFTVTYEANGGTGSMTGDPQRFEAESTPEIEECGFRPLPGYVFREWNTERDRSGTSYSPGEKIQPLCGDVVLYAVWAAPPTIARPDRPAALTYGSRPDLRFPYVESNNGEITCRGIEISRDGSSWEEYDTDTVPAASDDGCLIRYYATNFAGTSYTDPVRITVNRGHYDMSRVSWNTRRFTYDGTARTVVLTGLPEGLEAEYHGNEATEAGVYTASVTFRYDEENYEPPGPVADHIWEIRPASYDMSGIRWNYTRPFVYDGTEKRIEIENLPEGVSAVYYGNHETSAGTYAARAAFSVDDPVNYCVPDSETIRWDILRADHDLSGMRWKYDGPLVYDGETQTVVLEGIPEGVTATYYGNTGIEAGTYDADVTLNTLDRRNYNMPRFRGLKWEIAKADHDMSGVHWKYMEEPVYDGSVKSVVLEGLPEGVTAEYDGSSAVDAGRYEASAVLSCDTANYNQLEAEDFAWEIRKASYDMQNVRWDYTEPFVYDGSVRSVALTGLPEGVSAVYSGCEASAAGQYCGEAELSAADPDNYETPSAEGISWEIMKGTYDMSRVEWSFADDIVYDGTEKAVFLRGLPEGVTAEYEGERGTAAGSYRAAAVLRAQDMANYMQPVVEDCVWRIKKAQYDMSSVRWNDISGFTYDGTVKTVELEGLPEGVTAQYSENRAVYAADYIASAVFDYDRDNYEEPMVENCFWKIGKAVFDIGDASWDHQDAFIYDGEEKTVVLRDLPEGVDVEYKGNKAVETGVYRAEAVLTPEDDANYSSPHIDGCSWEIVRADIDMSGVRWCSNEDPVYDGQPKVLYLEGLPDGVDVVYDGGYETDAGTYQAEAVFSVDDGKNYNIPEPMSCSWEIAKADLDMSGTAWSFSGDFAYDGEMKTVVLTGLPEGAAVEYRGNSAVETGRYEAVALLSASDRRNYNDPSDMICQWEISRADLDMSMAEWVCDEEPVYDGEEKTVTLKWLPEGVNVRYEGNRERNAGFYTATAVFTPQDEENFNVPAPMTYVWEIHKGSYDMSGVGPDCSGAELVYDGTEKCVQLEGLPEGLTAVYSGNCAVNAGTYTGRAEFRNDDTENHKTPDPVEFVWEIKKAEYDLSGLAWTPDDDFVYDGSEKKVELTGIPDGAEVIYNGNCMSDAGVYTATAEFVVRGQNHITPDPVSCTWEIKKAEADISSVYWEYETPYVYDGTYKSVELKGIPEDMRVSYRGNTGSRAGKYTASAVLRVPDPDNYTVPPVENCEWEIAKAEYDMSNVEWTYDTPFEYDGTPKAITLTGLPEGVKAECIGNTWTDAGEYIADAGFEYDRNNYQPPVVLPCIWEIKKTSYDMSGVYWEYEDDLVYDGSEKSVYIAGLPEGVSASYTGNTAVGAGTYTACADFEYDRTNYLRPDTAELVWQIHKASYDLRHVRWDHRDPFVYDGTEKVVELERPKKHTGSIMRLIRTIMQDGESDSVLPEGVTVRYEGNRATDAGTYEAVAYFDVDDPDNYEIPQPLPPFEWYIEKGRYDMSHAGWVYDDIPVYDGTVKSVSVAGLPEGVKAICSDNEFTDAGTYTASAVIIINDIDNYEVPEIDDFRWKIEKGEYDMSHAAWDYGRPFIYDGTEKTVSLEGLPDGVTAELTGNRAVTAGSYTASAAFEINDPANYNIPSVTDCRWKIEKAAYDMSLAEWDYDVPFVYDGTEKSVCVEGLPEGVTALYKGNVGTSAGNYTAEAVLSYDAENYIKPAVQKCRWKISRAEYDMSEVAWDYDEAFVYDGTERSVQLRGLPEGVSAEYHGSRGADAGVYTARARYSYDRSNYVEPESAGICRWEILPAETHLELAETTAVRKLDDGWFDIGYRTDAADVTFSITDKRVASVSGLGRVTLNDVGSTVVTVCAEDKNHKKIYREMILIVEK